MRYLPGIESGTGGWPKLMYGTSHKYNVPVQYAKAVFEISRGMYIRVHVELHAIQARSTWSEHSRSLATEN